MQLHSLSRPARRTAVRYKLRLPVLFHWMNGSEQTEGGFTKDVSLDGALVVSSRCPSVGVAVRIELLLPAPYEMECELRVECIGKVTRIEERNGYREFYVQGLFDDQHLTTLTSNISAIVG